MIELRDYQADLIARARQAFADGHKQVLLQSPTGSGKTVTFCHLVSCAIAKKKKVLILAHRQELIAQTQKTFLSFGINAGLILAGHAENLMLSVQIASVQTLCRRLDRLLPEFDLIVIDEAHHFTGQNSYSLILNRFPNAKVLGVTATPCRLDGKGLGDLFEILVHGEQISALIEKGHLVKPVYASTKGIDLSSIATTAGDYNKAQLIEAVQDSQINGELVFHWQKFANGKQTIVFAVNCDHSKEIVQRYLQAGIPAAHVDGESSAAYRQEQITKFANKEVQILSNVGIFTEGFDLPSIECVQLARPTKSLSLYFQMVGRALRPSKGKEFAIILDHVNAYYQHGSVADRYVWDLEKTPPKKSADEILEKKPHADKKPNLLNSDGTINLELIDEEAYPRWVQILHQLVAQQKKNDYKKMWVFYKFLDKFPSPTLEQLTIMGKTLGCHWKWAGHKYEELKQNAGT